MERLRWHGEVIGRLLLEQEHHIPLDNRPTVSFPLGTSLVVLIIIFITAIFSFCYHCHKLRRDTNSALGSFQDAFQIASQIDSAKMQPPTKLQLVACLPVVYMPGDEMPKFIALPCPCLDVAASVSNLEETCDGNGKNMGTEAAMEVKPSL